MKLGSKDVQPNATNSPVPQNNVSSKSIQTPAAAPNERFSLKRTLVLLGVCCAVLFGAIVIYTIYEFITSTSQAITQISADCERRQAAATDAKNKLKSQLQAITIHDLPPQKVTGYVSDDCLDGYNWMARATATYQVSEPSVTAANADVMKALGATSALPYSLNFQSNGYIETDIITSLSTTIKDSSGKSYAVAYSLLNPVACQIDANTHVCDTKTAISVYLDQPINNLTLTLTDSAI